MLNPCYSTVLVFPWDDIVRLFTLLTVVILLPDRKEVLMTEFANQPHSTHTSSSSYSFFDNGDYDVASAHNTSSAAAAAAASSPSDSGTAFSTHWSTN